MPDGERSGGSRLAVAARPVRLARRLESVQSWRPRVRLRSYVGWWLEAATASLAGLLVGLTATQHWLVVLVAVAVWTVSAYHRRPTAGRPAQRLRVLGHSVAIALAVAALAVALRLADPHGTASAVLAIAAATTVGMAVSLLRSRLHGAVRVLVVGDRVAVSELSASWFRDRGVQVVAAGVVEPDLDERDIPHEVMGAPVVGSLDDVAGAVDVYSVDTVIVAPGPGFTASDFRRLAWSLERSTAALGVVGVLSSVSPHRVAAGRLGGNLVVDVGSPRQSGLVRWTKAAIDRVAGSALVLLAAPALGVLWLAVRMDSSGPGLYRQTRVGENGRLFTMYKLRTMHVDADAVKAQLGGCNDADGPLFKVRADPRVTRLGRVLRRLSLDELPQLLNVAMGEMSLVGPRPALPEEVAQYDEDTRRRLVVKPGLTGLWQVSGRSDLPWDVAIGLDLRYVDNWRLADDLVIGLRTVDAVVRSRGAY
jgi:exopolysaccharide biosynthesis polyprenyl glycosylphosphotransferase